MYYKMCGPQEVKVWGVYRFLYSLQILKKKKIENAGCF